MVVNYVFAIPLGIALTMGGGFLANEWSHGGLSEALGMGHRHALDFGGYHCAPHDDSERGRMHVEHMHQEGSPMPHDECAGGSAMHESRGNMSGAGGAGGTGMMP